MWTKVFYFSLFLQLKHAQAYRSIQELKSQMNPIDIWPLKDDNITLIYSRVVILTIIIPDYLNKGFKKQFIATGVKIGNKRILTSYTPFKNLLKKNVTEYIGVMVVKGFKTDEVGDTITDIDIAIATGVDCANPVISDEEYKKMHGWERKNSPVHDLMVFRMDEDLLLAHHAVDNQLKPNTQYIFNSLKQIHGENDFDESSIAGFEDQITGTLKATSLGGVDLKEMKRYDKLRVTTYNTEDVINCTIWMPEDWGNFICLRNVYNFTGLGSGATLHNDYKIFGIGGFAMFKGELGVLVYTDVRRYKTLIEKTCGNERSQNEIVVIQNLND